MLRKSNKGRRAFQKVEKGSFEKYCMVMGGHSVDFFIHILEHGHCLTILVTGYKEFH